MHNTITRLQTTFSQITSIAFVLALVISALSLVPLDQYYHSYFSTTSSSAGPSSSSLSLHLQAPTATLALRNVQVVRGRPHYYSSKREEYAVVRFDLDADLSPLLGWNTKQVFVYVGVEYPAMDGGEEQEASTSSLRVQGTVEGKKNKAVIWDTIIAAPASKWTFASVKERWFPAAKKTQKRKRSSASSSSATKHTSTETIKPGLLSLKNQKPKYQITDPSGIISSRPNVTLTLNWNIQPWVGPLLWDRGMLEDKNGEPSEAESSSSSSSSLSSWNLPFLRYQWQGQRLPRSAVFDFPPLKGAKKEGQEGQGQGVVKEKDGPKTPRPAEASGVIG